MKISAKLSNNYSMFVGTRPTLKKKKKVKADDEKLHTYQKK